MTWYEVDIILDNLNYADKNIWEMTRSIAYVNAQCHSTKKISPQDVIKFAWDNKSDAKQDKEISKEDIERLNKRAQEVLEQRKKKSKKK